MKVASLCRFLPPWMVGKRGTSGLDRWMRRAPCWPLYALAWCRRHRGYYDRRTLALFRRALCRRPSMRTLLAYSLFRRDLGFPLTDKLAARMASALPEATPKEWRRATTLLSEVDKAAKGPECATATTTPWKARLEQDQGAWRDQFAQTIRATDVLYVVGNAPGEWEAHSGPGTLNEMAVRFNRYGDPAQPDVPFGVWVASSECQDEPPDVPWVVVAGPDLRFRRQNWEQYRQRLHDGRPVLTVPLSVWKPLVRELQAPPTAGLLTLAWLRELRGQWEGMTVLGFNSGQSAQYHRNTPRQKAVKRHAWAAEQAVLTRWKREGLNVVEAGS